jgi:hypothetical protein
MSKGMAGRTPQVDKAKGQEAKGWLPQAARMLLALTKRSTSSPERYGVQHVYNGTVPAKVKARRRAANKRARIARRANR